VTRYYSQRKQTKQSNEEQQEEKKGNAFWGEAGELEDFMPVPTGQIFTGEKEGNLGRR
jgi:hypothetical protein